MVSYYNCIQPLDLNRPHPSKWIQRLDATVARYHKCTVATPKYILLRLLLLLGILSFSHLRYSDTSCQYHGLVKLSIYYQTFKMLVFSHHSVKTQLMCNGKFLKCQCYPWSIKDHVINLLWILLLNHHLLFFILKGQKWSFMNFVKLTVWC